MIASTNPNTNAVIEQFLREIRSGESRRDLTDAAHWLFSGSHGWNELDVRVDTFSELGPLLRNRPLDVPSIKRVVAKDEGVFGGFAGVKARYGEFLSQPDAASLLADLIGTPPRPPRAEEIDVFIDRATEVGIHSRTKAPDTAGSALFTSALLSSAFPDHFVDFRTTRWDAFAKLYFLGHFPDDAPYAVRLLHAAENAKSFALTPAFKKYILPAAQAYRPGSEPLWVVAALTFHIEDAHPAVPYVRKARLQFEAIDRIREVRERLAAKRDRLPAKKRSGVVKRA